MKVNFFQRAEAYSLIGLCIASVGFLFIPWEQRTLGIENSGLQLWLNLQQAISTSDVFANTARIQAIFAWLSVIPIGLVLQIILTSVAFVHQRNWWNILSAVVWGLTVLALGVLYRGFGAATSGVIVTLVGSVIALGGMLAAFYWNAPARLSDHRGASPKVAEAWTPLLIEARANYATLAVLALGTPQGLSLNSIELLQKELRGRDQIVPVQNGLFILLWQIKIENTVALAHKLQGVLGLPSRIGSANFPEDGAEMGELLNKAIRALEVARQTGDNAIVPASYPPQREPVAILAPWEALLTEARNTQTPLTLATFTFQRSLLATEIERMHKQLRRRDQVVPFENGFYLLLWQTAEVEGRSIIGRLQDFLKILEINSRVGIAFFPEQGGSLAMLLEKMNEGGNKE